MSMYNVLPLTIFADCLTTPLSRKMLTTFDFAMRLLDKVDGQLLWVRHTDLQYTGKDH